MFEMFCYLMVIFGIILASLVPKCSIISQMSPWLLWSLMMPFWHLLIQKQVTLELLWHHWSLIFGIFDIFGILASWDLKEDIIRDQRCLGFGIIALTWCLLLGPLMPKCQKCQKKKNKKRRKKMPKPENLWKPPCLINAYNLPKRVYHLTHTKNI